MTETQPTASAAGFFHPLLLSPSPFPFSFPLLLSPLLFPSSFLPSLPLHYPLYFPFSLLFPFLPPFSSYLASLFFLVSFNHSHCSSLPRPVECSSSGLSAPEGPKMGPSGAKTPRNAPEGPSLGPSGAVLSRGHDDRWDDYPPAAVTDNCPLSCGG